MARVLIVDDEPDVRELFNITLKMAGHATETAKDGMEAVDRLANGDMPDLILLDLMMPRLDGYGLLNHIRTTMDTKPIRVLVATAKVLEDADNVKLAPWPVVGVLNKGELDISAMVTVISTALSKEPYKKTEGGEAPKEEAKPETPAPAASATPAVAAPSTTPAPGSGTPATTPAPSAAGSTTAPSTPPATTPAAPAAGSTPPASTAPAATSPSGSEAEKPKDAVPVTTPPPTSGDKPDEEKKA